MAVTATKTETLEDVLNSGDIAKMASAVQRMKVGQMLEPVVTDTGTITASATVTLSPPALHVQSARVVTSGTAGSVGSYLVADAGATTSVPPGGANVGAGVATISADGTTLTFPNTITRAVIQYVPRTDVDPDAKYAQS